MTYLTSFVLFLPKTIVVEVILVETNRIIKGPDIDFGEFLRFIGIWLSMPEILAQTRRSILEKTL